MQPSKREALLEAAVAEIAKRGVRGLRVEDVAERAGVALSLVYYYFKSRAGLLEATLAYTDQRAPFSRLDENDHEGSAYSAFEQAMLDELGGSQAWRENCIVWAELTASAIFDPTLRKHVNDLNKKWIQSVASFIEYGRREGSIRDGLEPMREAEFITSLTDGLTMRWLSKSMTRRRALELLESAIENRFKAVDGGHPGLVIASELDGALVVPPSGAAPSQSLQTDRADRSETQATAPRPVAANGKLRAT